MDTIRKAVEKDLSRIAEIEVFNYRMNFYPIFQDDWFYFEELQVLNRIEAYRRVLSELWVFDDGVVKGFLQTADGEIRKLFVEPVLHGQSIGAKLLNWAVTYENARYLWALEKNGRAIAFYERSGFVKTAERKLEEDTEEYLVRMERKERP